MSHIIYVVFLLLSGWFLVWNLDRLWPLDTRGMIIICYAFTVIAIIFGLFPGGWQGTLVIVGGILHVWWIMSRNRRNKSKVKKLIGDKSRMVLEKMKQGMGKLTPRPVLEGS